MTRTLGWSLSGSAYNDEVVETLACRFVIPEMNGICPAIVSLSSELMPELEFNEVTEVIVYDINGRIVKTLCDDLLEAGSHDLNLETSMLSSGIYFVKFKGEGLNSIRTLTVLR